MIFLEKTDHSVSNPCEAIRNCSNSLDNINDADDPLMCPDEELITGDVSCSVKQEVDYSVHDVKKEEMIVNNDIDDTLPKVSTDTDDTLPPPTQTSLHEEIYQHVSSPFHYLQYKERGACCL